MSSESAGTAAGIACSVIVPIASGRDEVATVVDSYAAQLEQTQSTFEVVLVPSRRMVATADAICASRPWAVVIPGVTHGWGAAVRAGITGARGETVCYVDWRLTSPACLATMLRYATSHPDTVFRASRRYRDTRLQRVGSLLFNLECRHLLGVGTWDVNGSPKAFSRDHPRLFELTRDDGLIDLELTVVCEREGYAVAEIPVQTAAVAGRVPRLDLRTALAMYLRVPELRRRFGPRPAQAEVNDGTHDAVSIP